MRYELIGKNNYIDPLNNILNNRGIEDVKRFLNAGENPSSETDYKKLDNIDRAVEVILAHIGGGNNIWVQVDPDV